MNEPLQDSLLKGRLANKTGETILVYGPKVAGETRHNSLYYLPNGRKTPDSWDCDGCFIPNDRTAVQLVLPDRKGPVAVKYNDLQSANITLNAPGKYGCQGNEKVFAPGEVKWEIPNIPFGSVPSSYPEVPGHLPA
jgi:hypothetical protein